MKQTETKSYYVCPGVGNIPKEAIFLFCLGLFFFIPILLSLISERGNFDIYSTILPLVCMFPASREYINLRRNLGQPFIVLEADCFRVGRPETSILYAAVKHFVFDQSQMRQAKVAFSLFPKLKEPIADIKGNLQMGWKKGRIVCRPVKLHGAKAKTFFEDFGSRLIAAGAVNAMTDPENVAGINSTTGEALILPKKPLSSWLIKFGTFANMDPRDLKWVSFFIGSFSGIFISLNLEFSLWRYSRLGLDLADSIIPPVYIILILMIPIGILQKVLINRLDRVQVIVSFMEKTGEIKKGLLGASVGAAVCLLAALAFMALLAIVE